VLPYEGVKLLEKEVPQRSLPTVLSDKSTKPGEAEHLTLGIVSFYQPVAVEKGCLTSFQDCLLLLVALKTTKWGFFRRFCLLVRAQTRGYPEFSNSLWKPNSRKSAYLWSNTHERPWLRSAIFG
jgi:hypothetical protein